MSSLEKKKKLTKSQPSKSIPPNNLRNSRILKNPKISQWMLALKSNVPQSRISLIENHLVKPTRRECEQVASALNIDKTELFPHSTELEVPFRKKEVKSQQPQMEELDKGVEGLNPLENL